MAEGTQAGLVTNLDNAWPHVNFLLTYTDRTNIYLDKVVGGIYTNLISEPISYSAAGKIKVKTLNSSGNLKVTIYYADEQKGDEQTISGTLKDNTQVGTFSTFDGNSLSNFLFSINAPPALDSHCYTNTRSQLNSHCSCADQHPARDALTNTYQYPNWRPDKNTHSNENTNAHSDPGRWNGVDGVLEF